MSTIHPAVAHQWLLLRWPLSAALHLCVHGALMFIMTVWGVKLNGFQKYAARHPLKCCLMHRYSKFKLPVSDRFLSPEPRS